MEGRCIEWVSGMGVLQHTPTRLRNRDGVRYETSFAASAIFAEVDWVRDHACAQPQRSRTGMSEQVVFVIGATGSIGSATVQALSDKYAGRFDIRAGVRNPEKADKLKALPGVTVVQATMGDKDKLVGTLKGVDALFIVTPPTENRAELVIKTAEAAKAAGVQFLLVISGSIAVLTDTIFGKQLSEMEAAVAKLSVPHAFLYLPFFLENYLSFKDTIQAQNCIYSPQDPSKTTPLVAVEDAGKASATVLANWQKHVNKTYTLVSTRHSLSDAAKAISEVVGREVKNVQVPYDVAKQAMLQAGQPEYICDSLMEVIKLINNDSPVTNQGDLSDLEEIMGEQPTSLKAWLAKVGAAFK